MRRLLAAVLLALLPTAAWAVDNSITTPDAGKKLDTHSVSSGVGSVHRQGVVVCDPENNTCAVVGANGVKTDPRNLAHTTDSVQIGDGVDILQIDSSGRITVVATGTVTANQGGSWTVTANQGGSWTVASTQSGNWSIRLQDGSGNLITSTGNKLDVNVGTPTVNLGTLNGAALDSTLTSGNLQAILRGASKGGTSAANVTVSSVDANTNAVDVFIRGGAGAGGTSTQDNTTFIAGSGAVTPMGALFKASAPGITDGDVGVPMMDSSRRLLVACPTCPGGTGGTALGDKAAFTEGTTQATPISGVLNDTISADPTEDQAAAVRITAKRGLHVNCRNASGVECGTSGNPFRIDPTGTTTQPVSIPGGVSVSGTVTANLGTLNSVVTEKAQASTTSGQSGPLVQGAVTTSAPTYTTAQTDPLSLTTAGDLRVVAATGLSDRTSSGNIAGSGQNVAVSLQGLQGVSYAVTGTWTATLRCQVSSDGSTWVDIDSYNPGAEALQTDVTGNGQYTCDLPGGMSQARVIANAYTSGTAAVTMRANTVPSRGMHSYDRPAGQSLPNHTAWVGGTDGTNLQGFSAFDVDSGGGTQYVQGVSIRLSGSGGSVEGGTSGNPIRVDPTGATNQPVTISSGTVNAVGPAASGTAASGNPVQTGAVFRTTQPTVTNGQVVESQATARGALIVGTGVDALVIDSELPAAAALADGASNPTTPTVGAGGLTYNGTTWDRARSIAAATNSTGTGMAAVGVVAQLDDTSTATVTENQFAPLRITPTRDLRTVLVDSTGAFVSVGGGTQYDLGTAATATDKLNMAGVIRRDSAALDAGIADGDRANMSVDSTGLLRVRCDTGCSGATDTTNGPSALGALNAAVTLAMANQNGAEFFLASGTLAGTLTPEVSSDGGTTWKAAVFIDQTTGATSTTQVFTNPNSAVSFALAWVGPVSHARVRVSAYTSGTANGTIRATTNNNMVVNLGSDGTNLRTLATTSAGVVKVDASAGGNGPVNVAQVNGTTTDSNSGTKSNGTLRVVIATDQPQLTNKLLVTPDANSAVNVAQINGVTPLMGNGTSGTGAMRVTVASDSTGTLAVTNTGTFAVQENGSTSGGASTCYITSAASTNSTSCKGSAGQIYGVSVVNTTATTYYLRLYNSSSAPTCSSATGFIRTIPVLATGGAVEMRHVGAAFGTGIGFCLTGGGSSTDNTNAATGVYVTIEYK